MYLKSIELVGFKSFADKAVIELEPGATAIVGPNGCGKSNIADALRWVFGEQNPRLLRGAHMEDVIFNGTDNRKAVGRAEVSVTFLGAEQILPQGFHEVTITRRLYRSGESEYLINQNPCLLRDVREMFMGTGIGTSAYFLLEQGKIDMVLSAKPEERRAVFEEAAGILKYKLKKKASLHKLESTEANLIRISDIVREVKRQIISIERQAGKARRYQAIREELKNLELSVTRCEYENHRVELEQIFEAITRSSSERDALQSQVAELQEKIDEVEKSHQGVFDELHQLEKRDLELFHLLQSSCGELEMVKDRLQEFQTRINFDEEEIARSGVKINDLRTQYDQEKKNHEDFLMSHQDKRSDLEHRQASLEDVIHNYEKQQETLGLNKAKFIDVKEREAQLNNQLMVFHHRHKDLVLRKEKLMTEHEKVKEHSREKLEEKSSTDAQKDEMFKRLEILRNQLKSVIEEKDKCAAEREAVLKEISAERDKLLSNKVRSEMTDELTGHATVEPVDVHPSDLVFKSILDIPQEYRKAIRTALGKKSDCVLKPKRDLMIKSPSSIFYPVDTVLPPWEKLDLKDLPGVIGYAQDLIHYDSNHEDVVHALIGDIVIMRDFESLKTIPFAWLGRYRFVTQDGVLLDYDGTWVFDGASEKEMVSFAGLENLIRASQAKLQNLEDQKIPMDERLKEYELKIAGAQNELHLKELELAGLSGQLERMVLKIKDLTEEEWSLSREEEDLNGEIEEIQNMVANISQNLSELIHQTNELTTQMGLIEKNIADLEHQKESALIELAEVKVVARSLEEEEQRFLKRMSELESSLEDLESLVVARNEEVSSLFKKREEMKVRESSIEKDTEVWKRDKETLQLKRDEVSIKVEEIGKMVEDDREHLSAAAREIERARQFLSELEVKKTQGVLKQDNLVQRMKDKYNVDLPSIPFESIELPMEEIRQKVAELQGKLNEMGEVNMVAIQEYEEHHIRYEFLMKQQEDLVRSKDDLVKAIQTINITIREMFLDTFEKIQGQFNELFRKLFGGGRAVVELLDEGDVLECGIEVSAQPPGKKLQTISLLSGGEKTMTALALLLAIFKVRPSPFCFMDEMDAALDESNIRRFLALLDEFKAQTQFVLITHNKRTISIADIIYGVTMEESGISKIVSVRMAEEKKRDEELAAVS